jgi:hypothetical protein
MGQLKRKKANIIGEKGERIFDALLPDEFQPSPYTKDYGLDRMVDYFENETTTGICFLAQVKTVGSLSEGTSSIKVRVKTRNLIDYVDNRRLPVFLIVIDKTHNKGYWLFLQQYVFEMIRDTEWRSQKQITIPVPCKNDLSDAGSFIIAVKEAFETVCGYQSLSVGDTLAARRMALESLDPRFGVCIRASETLEEYTITPKEGESAKLDFKFIGRKARKKIQEFFDAGVGAEFDPQEFCASGSPLIHYILEGNARMVLKTKHHASVMARIYACKPTDPSAQVSLEPFPLTLTCGSKYLCMNGCLGDSPVCVDVRAPLSVGEHKCESRSLLSIDRWSGQRLRLLPYFEQIYELFRVMDGASDLALEVSMQGNYLFTGSISLGEEYVSAFRRILDLIWKARCIAAHFDVDPVWPNTLTRGQVKEIEDLWQIVWGCGLERPGKGSSFSFALSKEHLQHALVTKADILQGKPVSIGLKGKAERPFLGQNLDIDNVAYTLSSAILQDIASVKAEMERSTEEHIKVEFRAHNESILTVKLASNDDRD